jgi:hypothetical protein
MPKEREAPPRQGVKKRGEKNQRKTTIRTRELCPKAGADVLGTCTEGTSSFSPLPQGSRTPASAQHHTARPMTTSCKASRHLAQRGIGSLVPYRPVFSRTESVNFMSTWVGNYIFFPLEWHLKDK